jgi:hypothetical protein
MKFRKKPVVIEANQWWASGDHPNVGLYRHPPVDPETGEISVADDAIVMGPLPHCDVPKKFRRDDCIFTMDEHGYIDTLEGRGFTVCPSDWIITGVEGEVYSCKPGIFEATYEIANIDE